MTRLAIEGMTCGHCKKAVEDALASVDGVTRVQVDLDAGRADVEGGDVEPLIKAVRDEGYAAAPTSTPAGG
ncbi:MAG: cation transporter [Trueperaceae bacterium]